MTERPEPREPSLFQALIPIVAIALFLGVGYAYLGWRVEVMLPAAGGVAGAVGWRLGYRWKEMEAGIIEALGTLEDSGTVIVPLVPWSAAGAFMAGPLGVATV